MTKVAVTFDAGQVLVSFEPEALARKVRERGVEVALDPLIEALPEAWELASRLVREAGAQAAWEAAIGRLLRAGGASVEPPLLSWLYEDNRRRNLWRRPVPGVIELVRALRAEGVPVGVVSNSEGGLAELLGELGWFGDFVCVADSSCVGCEKPAPGIFHWAFERLGVEGSGVVHIGDSWGADVEGALGVGARAIWFPAADERSLDPGRVWAARSADEVAEGLRRFGVLRHRKGTGQPR